MGTGPGDNSVAALVTLKTDWICSTQHARAGLQMTPFGACVVLTSPVLSSPPYAAPHASETPNYVLFAAHTPLFLSSLTWIWSPSTQNAPLCFSSLLSIHLLRSSQVPSPPGSTTWPPPQPASWHILPVSLCPPYKKLSLQFSCYICQFLSLPY